MSEPKWGSQTEYWLGVIGYAVGYGNLWRFPYLLFMYGGPSFMLPYFLALLLLGIPIMLLESATGQMLGQPVAALSNISRRFKGIGVAAMIIFLLVSQYYVVLIAWTLEFFVYSFMSPLPWLEESDGNPWNEAFFEDEVLDTCSDIEGTSTIKWNVILGLLGGWILTYLCIWKGIKGVGKILYVTAPLPYILLVALFIRGITLEGATEGLKYFVTADYDQFFSLTTWRMACNQVLYSLGVGASGMVLFASCRQKNEPLIKSSKILPIINSATSLLASVTVFTFIGHMAYKEEVEVDELPLDGPKLAFVAYPISLGLMPGSNFWALLFFLMLLMLGLDSQFTMVETFLSFLESEGYSRMPREISAAIYCGISFFFTLIFALDSGQYTLYLFDRYVSSISLFLVVTLEIVAVAWVFGLDRLNNMMLESNGESISTYFQIVIKYVTPSITTILLLMAIISEILEPIDYPGWAIFVGWVLACTTIAPIVLFLVRPQSRQARDLELKENIKKNLEAADQDQQINVEDVNPELT